MVANAAESQRSKPVHGGTASMLTLCGTKKYKCNLKKDNSKSEHSIIPTELFSRLEEEWLKYVNSDWGMDKIELDLFFKEQKNDIDMRDIDNYFWYANSLICNIKTAFIDYYYRHDIGINEFKKIINKIDVNHFLQKKYQDNFLSELLAGSLKRSAEEVMNSYYNVILQVKEHVNAL